MPQTPSTMIPLGTPMPPFSLPDPVGQAWSASEGRTGTLVIFICNHCPFVMHVAATLQKIANQCNALDIEMVCINSNDQEAYPADSAEKMIETKKEFSWTFPYLMDESQEVAIAFNATCTPDIFLFNAKKKLFYRGQFDDSRPTSGESVGSDLLRAMKDLVDGNAPPDGQKPSIGCNIKWKA